MLNFLIHLKELKLRSYYVFFCFFNTYLLCYFFAPQIINLILLPLSFSIDNSDLDFIFSNIFEVFNTYIFLSLYGVLFCCIPIMLYSTFGFLKSGLFLFEKRNLLTLINTIVRFLLISYFVSCFFLIPYTLSFFFELEIVQNASFVILKSNISIFSYSVFICKTLFLYSFIIFQIPTVISIFVFINQPTASFFFRFRKSWLVISLLFGSFFSSSDYLSFFFISATLFFFFEIFAIILILRYRYSIFVKFRCR